MSTLPATNIENTEDFSSNNSFLVWGHDGNAAEFGTAYTPNSFSPSNDYYVMDRVWKVQETGIVGTLTVVTSDNAEHLIVHNSADFTTGTPTEIPLTADGNGNMVATVDLVDGQFFTFGNEIQAPGAVSADITLWLKANAGLDAAATAPGDMWADASGNDNNAEIVGVESDFNDNSLNFNPAYVQGDGIGDYLKWTAGNVKSVIWVGMSRETGGFNHIFYNEGSATTTSFHAGSHSYQFAGHPELSQSGVWAKNGASVPYDEPWDNTPQIISANISAAGTAQLINSTGGQSGSLDRDLNADISEIILYDATKTATELNRVYSYLGIKYGITIDQSTATDYIASDGTTKMWDATANSSYSFDIAGIGRDNSSDLNQKQSKSVNANSILTIGLNAIEATNETNTATFASDKNFMVWGNNGGTENWTATDAPSNYEILSRQWHMQETGIVGDVKMQFDVADSDFDVPSLSTGTAYYLIYDSDDDGNLSNETPIALTNSSGDIWETMANIDLDDGVEFTLATEVLPSVDPGGISGDLSLWLRADIGMAIDGDGSVDTWTDQSDNAFVFDDTDGNVGPTLVDGSDHIFNFNPYIDFTTATRSLEHLSAANIILTEEQSMVGVFFKKANGQTWIALKTASGTLNQGGLTVSGIQTKGNSGNYRYNGSGNLPGQEVHIVGGGDDIGGDSKTDVLVDGKLIVDSGNASTLVTANVALGTAKLGRGLNNVVNGLAAEYIIYNKKLTAAEWNQVNSYLAIKYGVTLDQSTPLNYLNSAGSIIWNVGNSFDNNIAGIGNDINTGLVQKQSKSINTGGTVTIYNGDQTAALPATNDVNTSTFSADQSYMMWGNDAGTTTYDNSISGFDYMSRTWKVQETGTVGTVTVKSDDANAEYLLVDTDNDGDFSTGTLTSVALSSGSATYDFSDGDIFTFGQIACIINSTYACDSGTPIDLTSLIIGYTSGGTWTDVNGSGANISDLTSVDFSAIADGSYTFNYQTPSPSVVCYDVIVNKVGTIPAPALDDITVCDGDPTIIEVPFYNVPMENLTNATFSGGAAMIARGGCSGSGINTCNVVNESLITDEGLTLTGAFDGMKGPWDYVYRRNGELVFRDIAKEMCLETPVHSIAPGDKVSFSVNFHRAYGYLESDDYFRIYSVIDGVETLEKELTGQISGWWQTFSMNNIEASTVQFKICMKNGDGIGGDGYAEVYGVGKIQVSITPALPTYTYYDADPAGSANVLGTGQIFDAQIDNANSPTSVWVTCTQNGCESEAEEVVITVDAFTPAGLESGLAYYCPAGVGSDPMVDLTNLIGNYVAGGTWTDDANTGVDLSDPTAVDFTGIADGGYDFIYTLPIAGNCNNAEAALVTIAIGQPSEAPLLSATTLENTCPSATADLNSLLLDTATSDITLVWSTDGDYSDGLSSTVADPTNVMTSGTYYAYFVSNGCEAEASEAVIVTLSSCVSTVDSDGDGLTDDNDLDDDNDGIADIDETGDTDMDGIPDRIESNIIDTDGDGNSDYNDTNADNEGMTDGTGGEEDGVLQGTWNDTDNDGIPDHLDADNGTGADGSVAGAGDSDNDGLSDTEECPDGYICPDADGDGIPDYMDTDSDNDGITDDVECPTGFPCTDTDNDGIADNIESNTEDVDGDGNPNYDDSDADGDSAGTDDSNDDGTDEGLNDVDGDGIPNYLDPSNGDGSGTDITGSGDSDNDGLSDAEECPDGVTCPDADGDGIPDYADNDSDNDGITDDVECPTGFPCTDTDNDGIADNIESNTEDVDGDGNPNYDDSDADGDSAGTDDSNDDGTDEGLNDVDGDGIPNYLDPSNGDGSGTDITGSGDSDNDGLSDAEECPDGVTCPDADGDGIPDYADNDSDNDGITDDVECPTGAPCADTDNDGIADNIESNTQDTDGDGNPDYDDSDADGDSAGTEDSNDDGTDEGLNDVDGDGIPNYLDADNGDGSGTDITGSGDSDGDGLSDSSECPDGITCPDTDGDNIPDYMDTDSDGDGIDDAMECPAGICGDMDMDGIPDNIESNTQDTDGDGNPDYDDTDADGDSPDTDDSIDQGNGLADDDGDGIPNYLDADNGDGSGTDIAGSGDSDGDGLSDAEECPDGVSCPDSDGDNIPDYMDIVTLKLNIKVVLSGAYVNADAMMTDSLRMKNLIPANQPYAGLADFNYSGSETVDAEVLITTGADAIVDWIIVELRDKVNPINVIETRAALLQRDGDIVDTDGISSLSFYTDADDFYVAVRHRNHLGCMTKTALAVGETVSSIDFTVSATETYKLAGDEGSDYARFEITNTSVLGLWMGNYNIVNNTENKLIDQGSNSDIDVVFFRVLADPGNTNVFPNYIVTDVYGRGDGNLDGDVIYQGLGADVEQTFHSVGSSPDNLGNLPIYIVTEQIPK